MTGLGRAERVGPWVGVREIWEGGRLDRTRDWLGVAGPESGNLGCMCSPPDSRGPPPVQSLCGE